MPEARVTELWRYPVKSMLGESCASLDLEARGVVGDRLFAVRNAEGHFGSGKDTRRFRRIDGLFGFRSHYEAAEPHVTFPDGRVFGHGEPELAAALSESLAQDLTITREADVSHLDAGPIHLLTTASLRWLGAQLGRGVADVRRFRPNLLLEHPGVDQVERAWIGREVAIGTHARLVITQSAERCRMVGLAQADLAGDSHVLKELARSSELNFGVYADVLVPGKIRCGDPVVLAP